MSRRNPHLDALRGIAVLGPVIHHAEVPLPYLDGIGYFGVLLFFVLSGFLITRILLSRNDGWGTFILRRMFRLMPAYTVALVIGVVFNLPGFREGLVWHTLYASNWYAIHYGNAPGAAAHLWSLSIEEQFYLFWPVLMWRWPNSRVRIIFAIIAVGIVWIHGCVFATALYGTHAAVAATAGLPAAFPALGAGALMAFNIRVPDRVALVTLCAAVALRLIGDTVFYHLLLIPGMMWLVNEAVNRRLPRIVCNPVTIRLGLVSYGIYLYHMIGPVQVALECPIWLRVPVALVLAWAMAEVSWRLVEKPVMGLRSLLYENP